MTVEAFMKLSNSDVLPYLAGGALLMLTPALVGIVVIYYLFRATPGSGRIAARRIVGAIAIVLSITFALGAVGVSLLQAISPDLFIALLILCVIFALFGAGKLYWGENDEKERST